MLSLPALFTALFLYLCLLFAIACLTERGKIPPALARHPLTYVLKEPGQGTGLGLPLVYTFVKDHDGYTDITSPDTGGTLVRMRFRSAQSGESGREATAQL